MIDDVQTHDCVGRIDQRAPDQNESGYRLGRLVGSCWKRACEPKFASAVRDATCRVEYQEAAGVGDDPPNRVCVVRNQASGDTGD